MKQGMDKITVILVVLGATWGAMFNVMKTIEMKNGIRNLVLDIDRDGKELSKDKKLLLLTYDYIPLWVGVFLFLLIFSGGLASIPFVYWAKKGDLDLSCLEALGCFGAAGFSAFAMIVDFVAGRSEIATMREYIKNLP